LDRRLGGPQSCSGRGCEVVVIKYKNPGTDIQGMWNMKCFVTPAIIGATGIINKELRKIYKHDQEI
jgi:hypothetical protein